MSAEIPADSLSTQEIIKILGQQHCDIRAENTAKSLTDLRIYNLLPQLVEMKNGKAAVTPLVDYDKDGVVETPEIRAALILAAREARSKGIDLKEVKLDRLDQTEACDLVKQLTNISTTKSCKIQGRS